MLICNYCDHYATKGYCDKCPYGSMLEADLHGELYYYGGELDWTYKKANKDLKKLGKELGWNDRPNRFSLFQWILNKIALLKICNEKTDNGSINIESL